MYLFLSIQRVGVGMEDNYWKNITRNHHLATIKADKLTFMPVTYIFVSKRISILHK